LGFVWKEAEVAFTWWLKTSRLTPTRRFCNFGCQCYDWFTERSLCWHLW